MTVDPITKAAAIAVATEVNEIFRNDPPPPPAMATREDVAAFLGCEVNAVKRLVRDGHLVETKFSFKWVRYSWQDVFDCANNHRVVGPGNGGGS